MGVMTFLTEALPTIGKGVVLLRSVDASWLDHVSDSCGCVASGV